MSTFTSKFMSAKQDWETPTNLFLAIKKRYNLNFDLAATESNAKCSHFFTQKDNALSKVWRGRCWLNPPYGLDSKNKLSSWVEKACKESLKEDCCVAVLVPARTNTVWWHNYCMKAKEILFIKGRPKFGNAKYGLPQPLAVVFFNGRNSLVVDSLVLKEE